MNCPCGTSKPYSDCCEPKHKNISLALTAEDLMRSRYSAFVHANGSYLIKSWDPKEAKKQNKKQLEQWALSVKWLRLEVVQTEKGQVTDTEGIVEFKAFFMENGQIEVIHETSNFKKHNGHWVYVKAQNN